jgi:hypothetical protein
MSLHDRKDERKKPPKFDTITPNPNPSCFLPFVPTGDQHYCERSLSNVQAPYAVLFYFDDNGYGTFAAPAGHQSFAIDSSKPTLPPFSQPSKPPGSNPM